MVVECRTTKFDCYAKLVLLIEMREEKDRPTS